VLACDAMLQNWFVSTHLPMHGYGSGSDAEGTGIWVEHRVGIAAIWMGGVGGTFDPDLALPRVEQSFLERLGLSEPSPGDAQQQQQDEGRGRSAGRKKAKSITKRDVKRAYYKKSIIWHPDKWMNIGVSTAAAASAASSGGREAAMPNPYAATVQTIFELVSEAYRELNAQMEE
jgi:hypothetical protein